MRPGKFKWTPQTAIIALVVLFLVWYTGALQFLAGAITGFGSGGGLVTPTAPEQDGVVVTKPLKFSVVDKFAGSAVQTATIQIYEGTTLKETLITDQSGQVTSTLSYKSDTQLNIFVTKANSKLWYQITVPRMSEADAQALAYNPIELQFFSAANITLAVRDSLGNSYTNGGTLAKSTVGDTVTLAVSWYVVDDNTGFIPSFDPIYQMNYKAVIFAQTNGTDYEKIQITGFDGAYAIGLSNWFYSVIPPETLTKWKVGSQYKYPGTGSISISLDLTGYAGNVTAGNYATLIFYVYIYTDPAYHQSKASFGPNAVLLQSFLLKIDG